MKQQILEKVTERFITKIEECIAEGKPAPWHKPWISTGIDGMPKNLVSKKTYRGFNVFLLSIMGGSEWWLTFNQAKELGGTVKKGEKGTPIIFWSSKEIDDKKTKEKKRVFFSRYYTVFNLNQCEGIEAPKKELKEESGKVFNPIEEGEKIFKNFKNPPSLGFGGNSAYYSPTTDSVNLPERENFNSENEYYSTLFHELVHSTGHKSRLARPEVMGTNFFGSHDYSKEELCAEFGAGMLCAITGIANENTEKNSIAYLKNWLGRIKNDRFMLVNASQLAQRAVDHILGNEYQDG